MMDLNEIELEILKSLSRTYMTIEQHLSYLKVKNRELTGVGMYVEIMYTNHNNPLKEIEPGNTSISTNERIITSNLKYGVGYEVDVNDGKINFIEFFTYGEKWDGTFQNYHIKTFT